jgi:hypothetical protein
VAGNDFDYIRTHAEAVRQAGYYNVISCSADALISIGANACDAVDLILGLECNDGHSLIPYKTFTDDIKSWLSIFAQQGGKGILVSGAFVGSDMTSEAERLLLADILKCRYAGKDNSQSETIDGMGTTLSFYRHLNEQHYAAQHPDVLQAEEGAFVPLVYDDNYGAAVAYSDDNYRTFTMGFPFECIKSKNIQASIMKGILTYLIK